MSSPTDTVVNKPSPKPSRKRKVKFEKDTKPGILYIRVDEEVKDALRIRCFLQNKKTQSFVLDLLIRELGLKPRGGVPPVPASAVPGVPEVAPEDTGKPSIPSGQTSEGTRSSDVFSLSILESVPVEKKGRKTKHNIPEGFEKNEAIFDYACSIGVLDVGNELLQFADYHAARGNQFLDWLAAWRTWARNSVKYQAKQMPNVTRIHKQSEKMRVSEQIFGKKEEADLFSIEGVYRRLPG